MSKGYKIIAILLLGLLALLTYYEATEPAPVNWYPSYSKLDKIPLGTYVFYNVLKDSHKKIQEVNTSPYEFLASSDSINGVYFFVNGHVNIENEELDQVLQWVTNGNTLFISAKTISHQLLDTLNLSADHLISLKSIETKPEIALTNSNLPGDDSYHYNRDIHVPYFSSIDTSATKVLGTVKLLTTTDSLQQRQFNFISQSFGNGQILLQMFPEAFANYFMLTNKNYQYTENLLAYIDHNQPLFWDNHYKSGKTTYSSPLYLLFRTKSLKWAYYTIIFGLVLFVIFEGKRKQRSIPVVNPLQNQSVAFAQTISAMYLERNDHKAIAIMQIQEFLNFLREEFRLTIDEFSGIDYKEISLKSGNSIKETKQLFENMQAIKNKSSVTNEELIKFVAKIKAFKNNLY
ncbi:DUF4350 domain-containing protein [Aquimarina intermedia]|uniref:Uncharacterized protein DUF4350 n=1 Tax=Aquimarina intermedia TaxID=350814 RepID=A0A5S5C0H8_9FLAO|nr:DUF4350 domain-containing protein [Aquimarina intermedia]TYP72787.1 uncharacterized protein DUF4350 [Aquimarina intermedia]